MRSRLEGTSRKFAILLCISLMFVFLFPANRVSAGSASVSYQPYYADEHGCAVVTVNGDSGTATLTIVFAADSIDSVEVDGATLDSWNSNQVTVTCSLPNYNLRITVRGTGITGARLDSSSFSDEPVPPAPNPGNDPKPDPGNNPAPDPGNNPGPNPGNDPKPDPGNNPAPNPGNDPQPNPNGGSSGNGGNNGGGNNGGGNNGGGSTPANPTSTPTPTPKPQATATPTPTSSNSGNNDETTSTTAETTASTTAETSVSETTATTDATEPTETAEPNPSETLESDGENDALIPVAGVVDDDNGGADGSNGGDAAAGEGTPTPTPTPIPGAMAGTVKKTGGHFPWWLLIVLAVFVGLLARIIYLKKKGVPNDEIPANIIPFEAIGDKIYDWRVALHQKRTGAAAAKAEAEKEDAPVVVNGYLQKSNTAPIRPVFSNVSEETIEARSAKAVSASSGAGSKMPKTPPTLSDVKSASSTGSKTGSAAKTVAAKAAKAATAAAGTTAASKGASAGEVKHEAKVFNSAGSVNTEPKAAEETKKAEPSKEDKSAFGGLMDKIKNLKTDTSKEGFRDPFAETEENVRYVAGRPVPIRPSGDNGNK